jgi:hypothetical protein
MSTSRLLAVALFAALAVAAIGAGCSGSPAGPTSLPSTMNGASVESAASKRVGATLSIKVPRRPKHHGRGAKYVSAFTESLTVEVQKVTASPWPSLTQQTLVVATPAPCTEIAGGALICTFNVKAYVGKNVFTFNEYAQKSPGPQDTPLATLASGVTHVGADTPSLSFTLEGIVNKVVLSVPDPESTLTPVTANTQPIPIGSPASFPLEISAQDAAGGTIATNDFASPITVSVGTGSAPGITLALAQKCDGDASTPSKVTLTCASDLNGVTVKYDGTVTASGAFSYKDRASISASPQPGTPAVPAAVALTTNSISYQLLPPPASSAPSIDISNLALDRVSGKLVAGVSYNNVNPVLVEFDPANAAGAVSVPLGFAVFNVFVDSSEKIWTDDGSSNTMHCFTNISAAPSSLSLNDTYGDEVYDPDITQDASGNIWYAGEAYSDGGNQPATGFTTADCSSRSIVAEYLYGSDNGYPYSLALAKPNPLPGVLVPASAYGGVASLYAMDTSVPGASPQPVAAWPSGQAPEAFANDPSYNVYAGTTTSSNYSIVNKIAAGSTSIQTLLSLPPESRAYGMSQYSGTGATAQALLPQDDEYVGGALITPVAATTEPLELPVPFAWGACSTAFDKNGGVWAVCSRTDGSIWATHTIVTSHWSASPNGVVLESSALDFLIAVPELGANSAPFTVTANTNPSVIATGTPWPASPSFAHEIPMEIANTGTSTLTIQDKNGRKQNLTIQVVQGQGPIQIHRQPRRHWPHHQNR